MWISCPTTLLDWLGCSRHSNFKLWRLTLLAVLSSVCCCGKNMQKKEFEWNCFWHFYSIHKCVLMFQVPEAFRSEQDPNVFEWNFILFTFLDKQENALGQQNNVLLLKLLTLGLARLWDGIGFRHIWPRLATDLGSTSDGAAGSSRWHLRLKVQYLLNISKASNGITVAVRISHSS